ncbi:MAG: hypothetical protein JSS32_09385 [Verrucomicrobia bacterium]|nr:hypothetical protein [Verrucomicrobiota bacterium]
MSALYLPVCAILAPEGNFFTLQVSDKGIVRNLTEQDSVHPIVKEALVCKTRAAVLSFLEKVQANQNNINGLVLWHWNHEKYKCHKSLLGSVHLCPIGKMITFVKLREAVFVVEEANRTQ